MNLTVHIPDEAVPPLRAKARGLALETFAEQVLLERIQGDEKAAPGNAPNSPPESIATQFQKEHGMWVYRTGVPMPLSLVDETLQAIRREREEGAFRNVPT